jgi:hypothetical protein
MFWLDGIHPMVAGVNATFLEIDGGLTLAVTDPLGDTRRSRVARVLAWPCRGSGESR